MIIICIQGCIIQLMIKIGCSKKIPKSKIPDTKYIRPITEGLMAKTVRKVVKSNHDAFWSHILDFGRTTFFELAICMGLKTLLCSLNAIHRLRS